MDPNESHVGSDDRARQSSDEVRALKRVIWAMSVVLLLSLGMTLRFAYQVRGLRPLTSAQSPPVSVRRGARVPVIKVTTPEGRQEVISYQDTQQPVVLYVFTPQCTWCVRNLANVRSLIAEKGKSYRFIGLSLTENGLKDYLNQNKIDFPVYLNPDEQSKQEYHLGSTPETIVISQDGTVLENWVGAYAGAQQAEVERFFGVKLPGLAAAP